MCRKKKLETDVAEKMQAPLAQRLALLITEPRALKDFLGCSMQAVNQFKLGTTRPSLENLCKIADFYGVSTDYLLGRTDAKSTDIKMQSTIDYTNLSEKAIETLRKFWEEHDYDDHLFECLNMLLENPDFYKLVMLFFEYKVYSVLETFPDDEDERKYIVNAFKNCKFSDGNFILDTYKNDIRFWNIFSGKMAAITFSEEIIPLLRKILQEYVGDIKGESEHGQYKKGN